ncbi:bacitracin export permease protein BceB family protein [Paenibacillus sp. oral taxon 786 str. D14]|uniref:ABC transporter permease n=1 Tax=Paenibacillus sp. oral taxon 786 TaxID=652715 RepID=UPI0001AFD19C|nr:FtsX-like permease family protein [Paenibacillus sp. oral taxon 786]EES75346.1 bacitracin export permease protein BceB family protein [Paenibacillus sp. oral taxon 786 str. D14]
MSLTHLIYRNLKKNLKNYYLYVFALIFSVALYFAFVTLQYDPALDEIKGSVKGAAGLKAASVLLIVIVTIFLLYANTIFIKRRSKEIGLFQLIGLTKGKIFRILSSENLMLYFGSMLIGIFVGFSCSRLLLMILFQIIGLEAAATLRFSSQALIQTVEVFAAIYLLIMLMNYTFIKRQSILSLFRATSTTENVYRKMPLSEIVIGILGIGLILYGYRISADLFSGDYTEMRELFLAMIRILGSVIVGTYLFYKGSVSFIFNLVRKAKGGYLSLNEVLSLSSIMFRMKSNALLLTIITTVSALAIGLLSLSYISYYSTEKTAQQTVPHHFTLLDSKDVDAFEQALKSAGIETRETQRQVVIAEADLSNLIGSALSGQNSQLTTLAVVDEQEVAGMDLGPKEALLAGSSNLLEQFMGLRSKGDMTIKGNSQSIPVTVIDTMKDAIVSIHFSSGLPSVILDHADFEQLMQDMNRELQSSYRVYYGIDIANPDSKQQADRIYHELGFDKKPGALSQIRIIMEQRSNMGLIMFIVGFLGLTFLITSGCILYFKQMGEGEEEKPSYTILRKLGFTPGNLLQGIQYKQLFNFGIPLVVGLSHSYFAVRSGWFLFGTELWTPMILVMLIYTVLYSIFGLLSVLYYKRVIKESL